MKDFIKKYKFDIIIVVILLITSLFGTFFIKFYSRANDNIAYVYCENQLIHKIDLNKEEEERFLNINGKNGIMTLSIKKNEIKVIESSCPKKDCIKHGKATSLNPIICAYNEVYIELNGYKDVDIELG